MVLKPTIIIFLSFAIAIHINNMKQEEWNQELEKIEQEHIAWFQNIPAPYNSGDLHDKLISHVMLDFGHISSKEVRLIFTGELPEEVKIKVTNLFYRVYPPKQ